MAGRRIFDPGYQPVGFLQVLEQPSGGVQLPLSIVGPLTVADVGSPCVGGEGETQAFAEARGPGVVEAAGEYPGSVTQILQLGRRRPANTERFAPSPELSGQQ